MITIYVSLNIAHSDVKNELIIDYIHNVILTSCFYIFMLVVDLS